MSACGLLQAVHHSLEDVAGMGRAPASDECTQQCSEFGFFTWKCFATGFEAFRLVCLSWCRVCGLTSVWIWKSPWYFHTSFQHTLEMLCSPWYILSTIPKLLVVVMGWYSMVWVSHRFLDWRILCEIWGVEGHLRRGDWIPLSTPQMECLGTATPSSVPLVPLLTTTVISIYVSVVS